MLSDSVQRNSALKTLYTRNYPKVKHFILSNSGDESEAEDVFQEAMLQFYQLVLAERFRGESSIDTMIYAMARNLWYKRLRELRKQAASPMTIEQSTQPEINWEEHKREQLVRQTIGELSADCQKIIELYYYERRSMEQIREQFKLGSTQVAKTKKYRCMKRLIDLFKQRGFDQNSFAEE